ncbi:hypothetical protein K439DRAFT_1654254 [Ramaria rubella]|nr:hypothetical protein K439DRAFT_1654254 [Ramaria rubella]
MGNTVSGSRDRHVDESVDFGSLAPQGVYTGTQDWNQQVVAHLIVDRKIAPFYRPLDDYDESWDDDRVLAARKDVPNAPPAPPPDPPASSKFHRHPSKTGKEPFRPSEASVYRAAIECPICFLYYPPNINRSRCCDQAICTECFVQIKRAEPTATHLVSEPASCPYCVQTNFGVTYEPPAWRTGLVSETPLTPTLARPDIHKNNSSSSAESNGSKRRRSFSADSPEVVTIDQIRPDWEAKLAAVRAAVTRRANRRIIMRQVGDRLIPIGVTSGRVVADTDGAGNTDGGAETGSGRRRRRNHGTQDLNQLLGSVGLGGIGGQDLEELMVMEAMRLSLVEHEEQQRRQNNGNSNNTDTERTGPSPANGNASPASSRNASPSPRRSLDPPRSSPPSRSSSPSRSPTRSRFRISIPSPLGLNTSDASTPTTTLTPTQTQTLAAALHAAQTASAFLNSESATEVRSEARSETPAQGEAQAQSRSVSPPPEAQVVLHAPTPVDESSGGTRIPLAVPTATDINAHTGAEGAGPSSALAPTTSSVSLASATAMSVSDGEGEVEGEAHEYRPLPSSLSECADPLLGWDKH